VNESKKWYNQRKGYFKNEKYNKISVQGNRHPPRKKVLHKMGDIIALVFFAMLACADEWIAYEIFGKEHEGFLRKYLELPYGIPSQETIQRVFTIVSPEFLQGFQVLWNEMVNSEEGKR
jgi:hypothetical protein